MYNINEAVQKILEGADISGVLFDTAEIIPFDVLKDTLVKTFSTSVDKVPLKVVSNKADWDNQGIISFISDDEGILSGEVNDMISDTGYQGIVKLVGHDRSTGKYKFRRSA